MWRGQIFEYSKGTPNGAIRVRALTDSPHDRLCGGNPWLAETCACGVVFVALAFF